MITAATAGITYVVRTSLYVALTNLSSTTTLLASRGQSFSMAKNSFRPLPEGFLPSAADVHEAVGKEWREGKYDSVVFAGLGEPTLRLDVLKESSKLLRDSIPGLKIRLNTNGLGSAHAGRDIAPELSACGVCAVSITLNTADPKQYVEIMAPPYGEEGLKLACDFAKSCAGQGMEVECTAVEREDVDLAAARTLALSVGSTFRLRSYHPPEKSSM